MYTTKQYLPEIIKNETWLKCFSPANLNTLLDFLIDEQWLPSQITIDRALAFLKFARTDGGSAQKDEQAAVNAAQRNLDAVIAEADAPPLTRSEVAEFESFSSADLQRRYWDNDGFSTFAVRYNKAARTYGFKIPPRPRVEEAVDESQEISLTAAEYHATPAQTICRLLKNPAYRRAVDRLIEAKLI